MIYDRLERYRLMDSAMLHRIDAGLIGNVNMDTTEARADVAKALAERDVTTDGS